MRIKRGFRLIFTKMDKWFSQHLLNWYKKNKRDLPWRNQTDPYKIWLSEIILQQTQVIQGTSYYLKFIEKYPSVINLANASEDEVLKLWQGLGYYSRARNLHSTAKEIVLTFNSKFPKDYSSIRGLKGIGDYTAAAICSFSFNLPCAVLDGNVFRFLSRLFGIETPIDTNQGKKEFQLLANELLDKKNPGQHNQAIMEFGSQFCKVHQPNCHNCIFNEKCQAFKTNSVNRLPVKIKKTKTKNRYFNYVVFIDKNNNVLLNKRSENDIWKGLYEFYLWESDKEISIQELIKQDSIEEIAGQKFNLLYVSKGYKHVLSHQILYSKFFVIKISSGFKKTINHKPVVNLKNYAFPRLIEKFLDDCNLMELV